jgi:kanamycin kinase
MNLKVESTIYETFPAEIQTYMRDAVVTIIKNKARSSVYHIEKEAYDIFLKVTPIKQMQNEVRMTDYLYKYGVCPRVLHYSSDDKRDYLITDRITGSDAASDEYLTQPDRLTEIFAESLVNLHRVKDVDCPNINGLEEMVIRAEGNYRKGRAEKGILRFLGYTSIESAYEDMIYLYKNANEDKVVIHGDYCLPNLILHDFKMNGYVDVGYGGIGDSHYDIFWGLWSLQHNLKSNDYSHRFVQAYGKPIIDQDRLRLCGLLSVFNGFRGQDYYEY